MKSLTILTDHVGMQFNLVQILRRLKRIVVGKKVVSPKRKYGGHFAVTRSIIEGLHKLSVDFNYNPKSIGEVGDVVVVLSGIDALRQAIQWKRNGKIRKLLAGPTMVLHAYDFDGILSSSEIDTCLVLSDDVRINYERECPSLAGRIQIIPVGVDELYWLPTSKQVQTRNVVVYWKADLVRWMEAGLCESVEDILRKYGWNPIRVVYGKYDVSEFRAALAQCRFEIFLCRWESQGISLAEAWAMDVPTLCWNQHHRVFDGKFTYESSACPYLTPATGAEWKEISELDTILENIEARLLTFRPRQWVLEHMTDAISAKRLLELIANA